MNSDEFDFEKFAREDVMYPSVSGGVILEGHDGAWLSCDHPADIERAR